MKYIKKFVSIRHTYIHFDTLLHKWWVQELHNEHQLGSLIESKTKDATSFWEIIFFLYTNCIKVWLMNSSSDSISVSNQPSGSKAKAQSYCIYHCQAHQYFHFLAMPFIFKHKKYFELMTNLFQHSLIMWTWGTMRGGGRGYCECTDQVRGEHEGREGG